MTCAGRKEEAGGGGQMRSTSYWLPRIAAIIKNCGRTLQQVDVVELQAFQAGLHRVEDVLPALAILVHVAKVVGRLGTPEALPRIAADGEVELLIAKGGRG